MYRVTLVNYVNYVKSELWLEFKSIKFRHKLLFQMHQTQHDQNIPCINTGKIWSGTADTLKIYQDNIFAFFRSKWMNKSAKLTPWNDANNLMALINTFHDKRSAWVPLKITNSNYKLINFDPHFQRFLGKLPNPKWWRPKTRLPDKSRCHLFHSQRTSCCRS